MQGTGTLEEQLEAVKGKSSEVTARKGSLRKVEELGANIEEALIFDNRYMYRSDIRLAHTHTHPSITPPHHAPSPTPHTDTLSTVQ